VTKTHTIAFLVSVFVGFQIHSQSYFNVLDSSSFGNARIVYDNNYYYCSGAVYNPSGSGAIVLSKYTLNGVNVLSDTFTVDGVISMGGNIAKVEDNLYLFNIINEVIPYEPINNNLQLNKMDQSFNLNFSTSFGGSDKEYTSDILVVNERLYLLGSTNSFGAGKADYYLIKTDTNGNVIWENTYGSTQFETPFSITPTQDDNLLLSGHKNINSPDWDIYLVMVDTAGNLLWEKEYGTSMNDYGGLASSTYDHSFIVYRNVNDGNGGNTVGYVEKLDGKGNIIWSKSFPNNTLSSFSWAKPIENSDGTFLVTASVKNTSDKMIGKIYKLDPFGNTLWIKEYYTNPNTNQYIYDVKATADSGYVIAGSARDSNLVMRAWLIKTNCNGEEGVQHPLTTTPCDEYDCTQYPIDASYTASELIVDLADGGEVTFENLSANTTSRVWDFGDGSQLYTDGQVAHTFTQEGIYEVQLIVFHATCSDTFSLEIEVTNTANITTHKALDKNVQLYPNPNNGSFTLQNNTDQLLNFTIHDAMGKMVSQGDISSSTQTNLSLSVPQGVYMVSLQQNGTMVTKKMVVR
jgi:hypothetical protein